MSQKPPTDNELRKLQGSAPAGGLRKLGDDRTLKTLTKRIGETIEAREEKQGPATYHCSTCRDSGLTIHWDGANLYSGPCDECPPDYSGPSLEEIRASNWEIDGDDRARLRYRRSGHPTLWIYPDGSMLSYPPRKELPPIPEPVYLFLYQQAKSAKRVGIKELTTPLRAR